jgi:segregation and condensation protein A
MPEDSARNHTGSKGEDGFEPLRDGNGTDPAQKDSTDVSGRYEKDNGMHGADEVGRAMEGDQPVLTSPQGEEAQADHDRAMQDMRDYKIALDVFEGPLDLLLYLIKRDEIDIYDIPIMKITDQYMRYLDLMRMLDLDIASEFLVMAATLLHIKSRMLLPPEERPVEEDEEEDEDPRMMLVRQLLEYKKFKEAAAYLSDKEVSQQGIYPRYVDRTFLPEPTDSPLTDISIFDLINAFSDLLKRLPGEIQEIPDDTYTVSDKIKMIMDVLATRTAMKFSELFAGVMIRTEVVVTFLALLELIRLNKIQAQQREHLGEIEICIA